jgi:hypothetical protein
MSCVTALLWAYQISFVKNLIRLAKSTHIELYIINYPLKLIGLPLLWKNTTCFWHWVCLAGFFILFFWKNRIIQSNIQWQPHISHYCEKEYCVEGKKCRSTLISLTQMVIWCYSSLYWIFGVEWNAPSLFASKNLTYNYSSLNSVKT